MEADGNLEYNPADWREILASFLPLDNDHKLEMEPFPNEKVLAQLANLAYFDCTPNSSLQSWGLPQDWELLTTARNNSLLNGYYGCAVWNRLQQQVVIAHRGILLNNFGTLWFTVKSGYFCEYTNHMNSAVTFVDDIKEAILIKNKQELCRFVLSISGHSLGAWLAGVTTLTIKYLKKEDSGFCMVASPGDGLHAHTLAIDSQGVKNMLIKICSDYDEPYNKSMCLEQLDITNVFVEANIMNSLNSHVGIIYHMHLDLSHENISWIKMKLLGNIQTHYIRNFVEAFHRRSEKYVVYNWPQGRRQVHKVNRVVKNKSSYYLKTFPTRFKGIPYNSEPWEGNFCQLGVFSIEEQKILQNWKSFQDNAFIKLTDIEKFLSHHKLGKITYPDFTVVTEKNTITCETGDDLMKVITLTKNLFRWFPAEIADAVAKQKECIKGAPLYLAGKRYLRSLPEILNCEDTLGVATFLQSPEQQVLQIEASDLKFEAARINNILIGIKNKRLDDIYLKESCHTFIDFNDMSNLNFEDLKDYVSNDNLLILTFDTPTELHDPKYRGLEKILWNLQNCWRKKLIIILPEQINPSIFWRCEFEIVTKPLKLFELSDLIPPSREEILARGTIAFGDKIVNLNTFLGIGLNSRDKDDQRKINTFISPILVKLAKKNNNLCVAKIKHKF